MSAARLRSRSPPGGDESHSGPIAVVQRRRLRPAGGLGENGEFHVRRGSVNVKGIEPSRRGARARDVATGRCRCRGLGVALVLGLVAAMGAPSVRGEGWDQAPRSPEPEPPTSVPFGSPEAAEAPEAQGTARRPIFVGVMSPPDGVLVSVSGEPMRLAPGVIIRDEHNRIIRPGTIRSPVSVRFTLDYLGQIQRVRIVPEAEPRASIVE